MSSWEGALFCDDDVGHKERRILARKLFLVPGDKVLHHPMDLLGQGEYFATVNTATACRWMSTFATLAAFDFVVSQILPASVGPPRSLSPEEASYVDVPLPHDAVWVCLNRLLLSALSCSYRRTNICWATGLLQLAIGSLA